MSRTKFEEFDAKAASSLNFLREEFKKIRSGRANPAMVEELEVQAYGAKQPLKNLANISVVDAQLLTVQPWDKSIINDIAKAFQEANIGITPVIAGEVIRLPLPPLTEERRQEYVKIMKQQVEESRIAIRGLRKDVLVGLANEKKDGDISEDEYDRFEKELQKKVDKANGDIEELAKHKEAELMAV